MKSIEVTARTVEEAIAKGLEELQASQSQVSFLVLEEGSKGLFGLFGSRPAKIRMTLKEDDPTEDLIHSLFAGSLLDEELVQEAGAKAPKKEAPKPAPVEKPAEPAPVKPPLKPAPASVKPQPKPAPVKAEEPAKAEASAKAEAPAADEKPAETRPPRSPRPPRPPKPKAEGEKPAEEAKPKQQPKPRKPREPKPAAAEAPAKEIVPAPQLDRETLAGKAQEYVQNVTKLMNVNVSVAVETDEENNLHVNMEGDTLGILIGRRGETLDALQYLTSLKVNRGQSEYTRVTLDTEGYRAKREEALVRLANRMANRCVKTGRRVVMEPMNPYERRILHSALQTHPSVTTHSEGEEPNRHVVITLKKDSPAPKAE